MYNINIDEKDKAIISIINRNPRVTQKQLAEMLGISQPAVSMRLSKLKNAGLIEIKVGLNPEKANLVLAKVDIKAKNIDFLKYLVRCPYVIYGGVATGKNNVCILMAAENPRTLEAIVNTHIRNIEGVEDLEFNMILDIYGKLIVPFKNVEVDISTMPCANRLEEHHICEQCIYYIENKCFGCPLTSFYKGKLFQLKSVISPQ